MNAGEPQAQQREVQRLLGRCLLRLQQYEHLMKAIVAHSDQVLHESRLFELRYGDVDGQRAAWYRVLIK